MPYELALCHPLIQESYMAKHRTLGLELLRLRKEAKLSTRAIGAKMGWSASTVSRLERGLRQETSSEEVAALLAIYGVTGSLRDQLLGMARWPSESGWWDSPGEHLPTQTSNYLNFENRATMISDFEPLLMPGLVQTPDYARAVIAALNPSAGEAQIEAYVARRIGRQAILSRPKPPLVRLLLAESALRRPVGGQAVMCHQVRHIAGAVEQRPHLSVQVLPDTVITHVGLAGPFVLMEFANAPTVVHVETLKAGLFLDNADDVEFYRLAADKLAELALSPEESLRLVADIAHNLSKE